MRLVKNPTTGKVLDVFGPTVEYLMTPQDTQSDFCVMKSTVPPGGFIQLHSHPDTEDFLILSGEIDGLMQDSEDYRWIGLYACTL